MTLESQRSPLMRSQCIEPGCDRPATEGDERCELHQVRLGPRPSRPSAPRATPEVIVETALDASVAIPPVRAPRARDYWLGLGGWALGSLGFFGGGFLHLTRLLGGALEAVFLVLWVACGLLATYGAGRSADACPSRVGRVFSILLLLVTGIPTALATLVLVVALLKSLSS